MFTYTTNLLSCFHDGRTPSNSILSHFIFSLTGSRHVGIGTEVFGTLGQSICQQAVNLDCFS